MKETHEESGDLICPYCGKQVSFVKRITEKMTIELREREADE